MLFRFSNWIENFRFGTWETEMYINFWWSDVASVIVKAAHEAGTTSLLSGGDHWTVSYFEKQSSPTSRLHVIQSSPKWRKEVSTSIKREKKRKRKAEGEQQRLADQEKEVAAAVVPGRLAGERKRWKGKAGTAWFGSNNDFSFDSVSLKYKLWFPAVKNRWEIVCSGAKEHLHHQLFSPSGADYTKHA